MIDWFYVVIQATWITGASICLSVLGIAVYTASEIKCTLKNIFQRKSYSLAIDLGAILFCAGLCGSAGVWWEKSLWGLLGFGFIADAIWDKIEQSRNKNRTHSE
jgi:hypothetical protein